MRGMNRASSLSMTCTVSKLVGEVPLAIFTGQPESLHRVKHVCDLGKHGVRRVIACDGDSLTVETMADVQTRIASISLSTGMVSHARSKLPPLKGQSAFAGTRWVRAVTTKRSGPDFRSTLQWQDEVDGEIYDACIRGETVRSALCPPSSDLLFVGTRIHPINGGGAVHCFSRGNLLWRYVPPEVIEYPVLKAFPNKPKVHAYPFRMRAPADGRAVGFSFLNYFYLLDAAGQPLSFHDVGALLEHELGCVRMNDVEPPEIEFEIAGETLAFACKMSPSPLLEYLKSYEHPCVQSVTVSGDGNLWLVSAKNVLVWITSTGNVANVKELPIGTRSRFGDGGAVLRTEVSASADVVIAGVCCEGLVVLNNGQFNTAYRCDLRGHVWEYVDRRRWIVLKNPFDPHVVFYDLSWNEVTSVRLDPEIRQFRVSEDGRFLFGLGGGNPVFLLSPSDN